MKQAVFRFAPSPNGRLHLGHAYSALLNQQMSRKAGGKLLLRIEDTDISRCTPEFEQQMLDDLEWLGIEWDGEPRRQSDHFEEYKVVLQKFIDENLAYPAFMSRREIKDYVEQYEGKNGPWPRDPDGSPHYPDSDRQRDKQQSQALIDQGKPHSFRLNMGKALSKLQNDQINFEEQGSGSNGESGELALDPDKWGPNEWGDVVLVGIDAPIAYHLACVLDDAQQGVTHIVRGMDLFHATSLHRLLQELLGLPKPDYFHHDLIMDDNGRKLSKSDRDTGLCELRDAGATPKDVRKLVGLGYL